MDQSLQLKLKQKRYCNKQGKKDKVDLFVRSLLSLLMISKEKMNFLNKKHLERDLQAAMNGLCFFEETVDKELWERLLYEEYCDMASFYFKLCIKDRRYGSTFMGTISMNEENVIKKLAVDIYSSCYTVPEKFEVSHSFRLLQRAMSETFISTFPDNIEMLENLKK